jgi:hypothetical protein
MAWIPWVAWCDDGSMPGWRDVQVSYRLSGGAVLISSSCIFIQLFIKCKRIYLCSTKTS